jgi:hypothetical protein
MQIYLPEGMVGHKRRAHEQLEKLRQLVGDLRSSLAVCLDIG